MKAKKYNRFYLGNDLKGHIEVYERPIFANNKYFDKAQGESLNHYKEEDAILKAKELIFSGYDVRAIKEVNNLFSIWVKEVD